MIIDHSIPATTKPDLKYYAYKLPVQELPPFNMEVRYEAYRGYMIGREGDYMHYHVKNMDLSEPIIPLRGSFTKKGLCEKHVDDFLLAEHMKQQEHDKKEETKKNDNRTRS